VTTQLRLCLLGFGEVGQALAADLRARVGRLDAWDLKFEDSQSAPSRAAAGLGVSAAADAGSAVAGADVVISAVTAAQIVAAARSVAAHIKPQSYFFDLNSTSPAAKRAASDIVASAGGRFVEAAIMSPIAPQRAASPILLGGANAADFLSVARALGFTGARVFSEKLGAASAAKMCRSVVIKGLEALMLESLMTARTFGVEGAVLDSLKPLFGGDDVRGQGRYMISRALVHGRRRAEEMREAARTVSEAGLVPRMSVACAEWEEWAAGQPAAANAELELMLDTLLAAQPRKAAPC
jgi:3-hydroxyisobutyrate dehydrogenase-like beta-hydroxyacid dehydrogenase